MILIFRNSDVVTSTEIRCKSSMSFKFTEKVRSLSNTVFKLFLWFKHTYLATIRIKESSFKRVITLFTGKNKGDYFEQKQMKSDLSLFKSFSRWRGFVLLVMSRDSLSVDSISSIIYQAPLRPVGLIGLIAGQKAILWMEEREARVIRKDKVFAFCNSCKEKLAAFEVHLMP